MINKINAYLSFFNNKKYLLSFDIARGLALFLILFMHIEAGFNSYTDNSFTNFLYIGPFGVPIFFFISGFLIFKSLNDNPNKNFFNFWYKRSIRLLPLYYSLLIIYIICIYVFSENLNNFQELNLSKILSSLFFGFGRLDKTYLSASWALWPEFAFYSFTSLLLIKVPKGIFKRLFFGLILIGSSLIFPGGGFWGNFGAERIEAIKPWTEGASSTGILLTCFGNLIFVLGTSFFLQSLPNIFNLIFKNERFIFKKDNILILLTFILSSYFYLNGSLYFYFASGALLFFCFKIKNFQLLLYHFLLLILISKFSYINDINSLTIYFSFLFIPLLEKLTLRINSIFKRIIKFFSKISYTIYLVQIFTIPTYFKIASFYWRDNLLYWNSFINCILFTITLSYIAWQLLEKPLNKLFLCFKNN